jgi:23S rRNA (adenine1618-N6)-methyltransferase
MLGKKKKRDNFNDRMNPKNIYYQNAPDFKKLVDKYPEFANHVYKNKYSNYSINWKCKDAMKELCKTLLKEDFKVDYWSIPEGYLIPSITSRLNYINWIHDLLESSNLNETSIKGLDIGTGANLIYPILGYSCYKWNFMCSDINLSSLENAKLIVSKNKFENKINIVSQPSEDKIFENIVKSDHFFHFSMCNPPYFKTDEIKRNNPHTVCEYDEKEVYCQGGEEIFVIKMINESQLFKSNVLWFTTLVGKKENFDKVKKYLEQLDHVKMIKTTIFFQGKLARWGLAWTYFSEGKYTDFKKQNKSLFNFRSRIISKPKNNNYCKEI